MGTLELGMFSGVLSAADRAARPLGRRVRTPSFGAPVRAPLSISGRAPTRASPASSRASRPFVQARAGSRAGESSVRGGPARRRRRSRAGPRQLMDRLHTAAVHFADAQIERAWAIGSAHQSGLSIRRIAAATDLSPSRLHQILASTEAKDMPAWLSRLTAANESPTATQRPMSPCCVSR